MKSVSLLAVLVLALQFTVSCTAKTEPATEGPPPSEPPNLQPNPRQSGAEKAPQATQAPRIPTRAFDESLLRGREFLLETAGTAPGVHDFDLGTLGNDAKLNKAVEDFFADAADGSLEAARVSARWAGFLNTWAAGYKKAAKKWDSILVGEPVEEEHELLVPFKLLSNTAAMTGWLALSRKDGDLLVNDVRTSELVPRTSPFDPDEPQEISSPNRR